MSVSKVTTAVADAQQPTVHAVPWRFRESSLSHNDLWFIQSGDGDGLHGRAAETFTEANARLIVTAVNHHSALVDALNGMLGLIQLLVAGGRIDEPEVATSSHRYRYAVAVVKRIEDGQ